MCMQTHMQQQRSSVIITAWTMLYFFLTTLDHKLADLCKVLIGHNWLHCRIRKHDTVPEMSLANLKDFFLNHICSHFHCFPAHITVQAKVFFDALKSFLINFASLLQPLGTSCWHQSSFPKRTVNIHLFTSAHFSHDRLSNPDLPWRFLQIFVILSLTQLT